MAIQLNMGVNIKHSLFLPRDAMRSADDVVRCLSVCPSIRPSVTFLHCVKTFLAVHSHSILVLPYQTLWQYSDGDPLTASSNTGAIKVVIFDQYKALSRKPYKIGPSATAIIER